MDIDHADFMRRALECAKKSRPSPNPRVGAVVVKENRIVGRGYHKAAGLPHAEIVAMEEAGELTCGATLYVTLEPCCHQGRTGPCTQAIISRKIDRVIIGILDADPRVNGKSVEILKKHCDVETGVLAEECRELLEGYIHHRSFNTPLVTLKAAVTLDGFIATETGESKWITSKDSRTEGHRLRSEHDGVITGIGTVLADNPELTVRNLEGINPARIVLDTNLEIGLNSRLIQTIDASRVIVAHGINAPTEKKKQLETKGVELICVKEKSSGRLDIKEVVDSLQNMGMISILVEGGKEVLGSFIQEKVANRFFVFVAPKLLGKGKTWADFPPVSSIDQAMSASFSKVQKTGDDIVIQGTFK